MIIGDLFQFEQRWRDRRAVWVPKKPLFDSTRYSVDIVPEALAKHFVVKHHYSGTYPAARFRVGLFREEELVGVAVFSQPVSQQVISRYADIDPNEGVELGRFVLLDSCKYNAETWFLSRAQKLLKKHKGTRFCLSYSDPIPRHDDEGNLIKPGHIGQIYQALNASYFGRSSSSTLWLMPDGRVINQRSLGKVRRGESGKDYATAQLIRGGAPPPLPGESGASYVQRIDPYFRKIRHPGNLAYGWRFDKHVKLKLPELGYVKLA